MQSESEPNVLYAIAIQSESEPVKPEKVEERNLEQSKAIKSPAQGGVAKMLGTMMLGTAIGIAATLGVLRHLLSEVKHWKKESAVANELLRERFIADRALHELSISQLLELSDNDIARTAHAQILGAYSAAAEGVRTPPIEDKKINDTLDYLEKATQRLEAAIAGLGTEGELADAGQQRELVHSLGLVRHASLQSIYAMYQMGDDRPESATDKASQQLLRRFETLHGKAVSLFESAFAQSDVYEKSFEEHNVKMLRGRSARGAAFVNKNEMSLEQHSSLSSLGGDFQGLAQ